MSISYRTNRLVLGLEWKWKLSRMNGVKNPFTQLELKSWETQNLWPFIANSPYGVVIQVIPDWVWTTILVAFSLCTE